MDVEASFTELKELASQEALIVVFIYQVFFFFFFSLMGNSVLIYLEQDRIRMVKTTKIVNYDLNHKLRI